MRLYDDGDVSLDCRECGRRKRTTRRYEEHGYELGYWAWDHDCEEPPLEAPGRPVDEAEAPPRGIG